MRKLNKKKVTVTVLLAIIIIIELLALRLSRAENIKEINLSVLDSEGYLEGFTTTINAFDGGDSGYYIVLPETVNSKQVLKYIVEEKTIEKVSNEELTTPEPEPELETPTVETETAVQPNTETEVNEEETNTEEQTEVIETDTQTENIENEIIENEVSEPQEQTTTTETEELEETITEEPQEIVSPEVQPEIEDTNSIEETITINTVEKIPGEKVYLTTAELENAAIQLQVVYDTKEVEGNRLYNTKLTEILETGETFSVQGYMLLDTTMKLGEITEEQAEIFEEANQEESFMLKQIYDVKLINNEKEYIVNSDGTISEVIIENVETSETINENAIENESEEKIETDTESISEITQNTENNQENDEEYTFTVKISGGHELIKYRVLQQNLEGTIQEISDIVLEEEEVCITLTTLDNFAVYEDTTEKDERELDLNEVMENAELVAMETAPMLFSSNPMLYALANLWDGTVGTGIAVGDGSAENPYLISTAEELAYIAQQVDSGNTYEGEYFQLIDDINLGGQEWNPIGTYTNSFRGIFDGAGHIIANAEITITGLATSVQSYGIFGSIGGGTADTEIRNVEFRNINVTITANGTTANNQTEKGYNIGFVTGTMFRNSTVKNVIVKESTVTDSNTVTLRNAYYQVLIGGIAGEARNTSTSATNPGDGNRYLIENCYVAADMDLSIALRNNSVANAAQYNVGGIIGRIRAQAVWPTNCLFSGSLNCRYGFIGPIFGALRNNTAITSTNNFATLWNGNDSGNLTMNSYYTNYTAKGTSFTANQASGTSTSRVSNSTNNIGHVQGVNKGLYTANVNNRLDAFNSMAGGYYVSWEYVDGDLTFIPKLTAYAIETQPNIYKINVDDPYNIGSYTYRWYVNGTLDTSITGDTSYEMIPNFDTGYDVRVLIYDGAHYAIAEFEIPKLYIDIAFDINEATNSVQASLYGTALPYVNLEDYTYTWYSMDITGTETLVEGANTLTLNNLENGMEYKLIATNTVDSRVSAENSFIYGDRIVVFVDYVNGNNNNDGFTPETAVETLDTAYGKLSADGTRNENVIVMMEDYTDTRIAYFNQLVGSTNRTYAKKATITGKYGGVDYNPVWRFGSTNSSYYFRYLSEDLTIMNLTLNGGGGYMYLICQGHSFTVGEDVTMTNYTAASTNQGLLGNRAPGFHLFAGWYQYNLTELPANNSEIIIKSGTYGRIILGGTPGTSSGQGQETSMDFIGTEDEYFNVSFTMDIKNSTTAANYDYDVNLLVGGSACGNNYSIVNQDIISGSVGRLCGGSIGDSATRPTLGWNQPWPYPENTFLGETTINISGGTVEELYGGCLGRNMNIVGTNNNGNACDSYFYGDININITGGRVTGNIYGAGAGGVTGYDANSSDPYKSYGASFDTNVNINISGGTIDGDVYGGGYGYTEYLNANVTAVDGGALYGDSNITISGSPTINGNIYAAGCGYNLSSKPNIAQMIGNSSITIGGTPTINGSIFGGGAGLERYANMAKLTGASTININANLTTPVYGGGNIAQTQGTTNINILSGTHTADIYGGGNVGIVNGTANVTINGGTQNRVFGGGNEAETTTTNVYIKGGNTSEVYGGGNLASVTTTNVYLQGGTANNVYAGSNQSGNVTTANLTTSSGTATNVYGGNNQGGTVTNSYVTVNGGNITTAYGGNNAGGTTVTTEVRVKAGTLENVFGGGNEAGTTTTSVYLEGGETQNIFGGGNLASVSTSNLYLSGGETQNAYGGGNLASVTTTNVSLQGGIAGSIYAGSNQSGNVRSANLTTTTGTATNIYGGNNQGGTVTNSYVTVNGGSITNAYGGNNAGGTTVTTEVRLKQGNVQGVFGGGNEADTTTSNVYLEGGTAQNTYGGGNAASVTTTNVTLQGGYSGNIFGGSNQSGNVQNSYVVTTEGTANNVYGGNNQGGITQTPDVEINGGTIGTVYGGGNRATVRSSNVKVTAGNIQNVFGGGNAAGVDNNTNLIITGGVISNNIYGGGNEGIVIGNTSVRIKNGTIRGSAYAGGNGATAIVYGNTTITIEGTATIGSVEDTVSPHKGSVFGSGNAAATGREATNNSVGTVNIVGGTIYGNVYGGANTSIVYGYTNMNIGAEAVQDEDLEKSDIYIRGTIFGGGEANASGSEIYDFNFISVTQGIEMNIDGTGYTNFKTEGSIFGSGNASSTSGESNITIKNYGTVAAPNRNISIQRASLVTIDNSAILLIGETDSTNELSNLEYTFNRIDHLKIKNNTTMYLNAGANVLKEMSSLVDIDGVETLSTVVIDEETGETTKNVDNRIYMKEGKILNVALNQNRTVYGEVNGMTFLGVFTNNNNPSESTGLYNYEYENGEQIVNAGTFVNNGKVSAKHKTNHDIHVDGFYTNYDNEGYIKSGYVGVTPEDDIYYIWQVGEEMAVTTIEMELLASKFATLGTKEQILEGFSKPNTTYHVVGFTPDLTEGVSLVDSDLIEPIAPADGSAENVFGLSIKTAKKGWLTDGRTDFYTANAGAFEGTTVYKAENSASAPSLVVSLYHSQNITVQKDLGTVTIRLEAITPRENDLNFDIAYIDIVIMLSTVLSQENYYETAISPGEEFELFTTTETAITTESVFSTYYSLLLLNFSQDDMYEDFETYNRVLASRDANQQPYVYKENTKIIMLDMATNKYYYYVVTEEDETSGKHLYYLKDFIEMGSTDVHYDETRAQEWYYYTAQDLIYENFICHVDVSEADITENAIDNTLYIELQDADGETLIGIYDMQRDSTKYSIYTNKDATIGVTLASEDVVYLGNTINLDVTTNFTQQLTENDVTIFDTKYLSSKMGIKISIFDINGNQLNSDSLLGTNFIYDGITYYPRIDGSVRINVADRVSNVLSKIKIDTKNNTTIATGEYTIKVETFSSPDGIYYGLEASDYGEKKITIINGTYGLKVTTDDNSKIVDKVTGKTLNNNNSIVTTIEYSSLLENPNIVVELQRRDYSTEYTSVYQKVDFTEYFTNQLKAGYQEGEYLVIDGPVSRNTIFLYFGEDLVTGTYKMVFKLYDGSNYIGEAYEYFIIK